MTNTYTAETSKAIGDAMTFTTLKAARQYAEGTRSCLVTEHAWDERNKVTGTRIVGAATSGRWYPMDDSRTPEQREADENEAMKRWRPIIDYKH